MAYTGAKLISNAYYLAGIVSRNFESVGPDDLAIGLDLINEILDERTVDKSAIPYFTSSNFTSIVNQETYQVDDLIDVSTLTFVIDSVRYAMTPQKRNAYFGDARANNISTLPGNYHVERNLEGATISVYPLPDREYPFTLWGKFRLSSIALNQNLETSLNKFYIKYLRYLLASALCDEFNYVMPANAEKTLNRLDYSIKKVSAVLDLKTTKKSTLNTQPSSLNYGQVNIGRGWTVPK